MTDPMFAVQVVAEETRQVGMLQSASESATTLPGIYHDLTRYPIEDIDLREMLRTLVAHLWRIDSNIQRLEVNIKRDADKVESWDALVANQDAVDAAMGRPPISTKPDQVTRPAAVWEDEGTWSCGCCVNHDASVRNCPACGDLRP